MFPISWNKAFRNKDGTLVNMEDVTGGGGGSELPEHSSSDAGKVLGVDSEGLLEWKELEGTKIYYKDFNVAWGTPITIAKYENGAASASGLYSATPRSIASIKISGYTPISAIAFDQSTGYNNTLSFEYSGTGQYSDIYISQGFFNRSTNIDLCKARVFYVNNNDLVALT